MSHDERLQRNELEHFSQAASKWFEKYGMAVVGGICGLLVVGAITLYVMRSRAATTAAAWAELRKAQATNSPEDLLGVANHATYRNTPVGAWARLHSAELRLSNSIYTEFTDREASITELEQAQEDFETLVKGNVLPVIRERALYGLATTQEALSDGSQESIDAALKTYQTLLDEFEETEFKTVVERRIKELKTDTALSFYTFFSEQKPEPEDPRADPSDTGSTTSLEIPEDLLLLDSATPDDGSDTDSGDGTETTPDGDDPDGGSDADGDADEDADSDADAETP